MNYGLSLLKGSGCYLINAFGTNALQHVQHFLDHTMEGKVSSLYTLEDIIADIQRCP